MSLRLITEQNDENGRWMWKLVDGDRHVCMSDIHGHAGQEEAREAAKRAFSQPVTIDGVYGEEFAGERDFSD